MYLKIVKYHQNVLYLFSITYLQSVLYHPNIQCLQCPLRAICRLQSHLPCNVRRQAGGGAPQEGGEGGL